MMEERQNAGGKNFGEGLRVAIFSCKGASNEAICNEINQKVIAAIKMNKDELAPKCWEYPLENGKGGIGLTLVQPLVESFIAWDTWPSHDGAYLFVVSCKEYDPLIVETILNEYFEVKQKDILLTQI
jgi:S-adenosylmethionine/arginine decarboxylase-like enzyme